MVELIARQRLLRALTAVAVALISSPLARISADSFLGLGSVLVVPTFAVATWFTLTAFDRQRRAWWLGFAVCVGLCLPLCAWVELELSNVAVYLQRLTQQGTISLSQRVIEPTLLILIVLCPLVAACLLGIAGGRIAKHYARNDTTSLATDPSPDRRWRFSIRELLIGFGAICFLTAWIGSQFNSWKVIEIQRQSSFLTRFESSFTSGQVKLMASPTVLEQQRSFIPESGSFRALGVNEYRITLPIEKDQQQLWAVWAYTCNEDSGDFIYQYAYAQAPSREELPKFPWPAKRYIEGTWELVDGVPKTAGPTATVLSVTAPAVANRPIILRATAPPGTTCELLLFPSDVLSTQRPLKVGKDGTVQWSFDVPSQFAGYRISYELRCIQQYGSSELISTTGGNVNIVGPESEVANP